MTTLALQSLGKPHLRLELLSDPTYLSGAREMIAAVARRLGFEGDGCNQIALAVDEALCNVIRHGYDRRKDGPIWISIWPLAPGQLAEDGRDASTPGMAIVLEDEARQVDPAQIRSRDLDEIRPGGLGVHIIKQVMDRVVYEKREQRGMRLVLVKRVPPGGDGAAHAAGDTASGAQRSGAQHGG